MSTNLLQLGACIAQIQALRYTPAGIPALNLELEHGSELSEMGQLRAVKASVKAVAFGVLAERLAATEVGSCWKFSGFVANARQGKSLVFHIQDFVQD